jgi:flagellar biosynthesis regulator FlaF
MGDLVKGVMMKALSLVPVLMISSTASAQQCDPIRRMIDFNNKVYEAMRDANADAKQCENDAPRELCQAIWSQTIDILAKIEKAASDRTLVECPLPKIAEGN